MSGGQNRYSSWPKPTSGMKGQEPTLTPFEKKLVRDVYWEDTKDSLKADLTSELGRQPSEKEVERAFEISMNILERTGALKLVVKNFREAAQDAKTNPTPLLTKS